MTSPQATIDVPERPIVKLGDHSPKKSDRDFIVLQLARIHPDPFQPREHPDDELAASIKEQGILQPFAVEVIQPLDAICPDCGVTFAELAADPAGQYMINDGERRWRGAKSAGLRLVEVELVAPSTEGKRLLRQVTANTGKPLTVVEQAKAYKAIMIAEGWSQAQLARHLGIARSVVGDRIRLIELDAAWLEAIDSGQLQVSHSPFISQYRLVPTEYQRKAATKLLEDYRTRRYLDNGGSIPVDEFPRLLYLAFRDYIKSVDKTPGYKGPKITIKGGDYSGKTTYAADMKQWRPCFKKYEAKRKKETPRQERERQRRDLTVDKLERLPREDVPDFHPKSTDERLVVYRTDEGWDRSFKGVPEVFLDKVDPAKLVRLYGVHNSGIATTDLDAVAAARKAFDERLANVLEPKLAEVRAAYRNPKMVAEYSILGKGTRALIDHVQPHNNPIPVIAMALGLVGKAQVAKGSFAELLSDSEACTLASGYVAAAAGFFKVPDIDQVTYQLWERLRKGRFPTTLWRIGPSTTPPPTEGKK